MLPSVAEKVRLLRLFGLTVQRKFSLLVATPSDASAFSARANDLPLPKADPPSGRVVGDFKSRLTSELDGRKVGEMNCRQAQTIVQVAEILLDACGKIELRTGKPVGIDAKNAIAKRLVRNYGIDLVSPFVLTAAIDFRSVL